jgi:tyrosyl-tRNA synthetase
MGGTLAALAGCTANITAGLDLIRRIEGAKAHGLVMPLITTSAGTKFGKTESGTVWLDAQRTSPYEFYQFWLNVDDRDGVRYLRFFTFLDEARIREIEAASTQEPERRHAQRELAREITRLVHGDAAVQHAEAAAAALFNGDLEALSVVQLLAVLSDAPSIEVMRQPEGWRIQALLVEAGLVTSTSEANRLIKGRGISVNGRVVTDEKALVSPSQAIEGQVLVLGRGKKDKCLVRIT